MPHLSSRAMEWAKGPGDAPLDGSVRTESAPSSREGEIIMTEATQVSGVFGNHGERAATPQPSISPKRRRGCGIWSTPWRSSCWRRRAISSPRPSVDARLTGYIRFAHLTIGSLGRVYWAFAGNAYARLIFALPLWNPKWV